MAKHLVLFCVFLSSAYCSVVPLDTTIVNSQRLGDSFAYSTLESHGTYTPLTTYTTYQFPFTHPLYGQQFIIQSPIFSNPILGQNPLIPQGPSGIGADQPQEPGSSPVASDPTLGQQDQQQQQQPSPGHYPGIIGGLPINFPGIGIGQYPGIVQHPSVVAPGVPGLPGIGGISQQPGNIAQTPVQGTLVDDDTVSVEAAA